MNTLIIKCKIGEEVIYRHDITKGFWNKRAISAYLISGETTGIDVKLHLIMVDLDSHSN